MNFFIIHHLLFLFLYFQPFPDHFWGSQRMYYNKLTNLLHHVNKDMARIILISYSNNLFYICLQLYHSVTQVFLVNFKFYANFHCYLSYLIRVCLLFLFFLLKCFLFLFYILKFYCFWVGFPFFSLNFSGFSRIMFMEQVTL